VYNGSVTRERKIASTVAYEMDNSSRAISLSAIPLAERGRRIRAHGDTANTPIVRYRSKHVYGQYFLSPAVAAFDVVFG
jgi:hypothetical protein